MLVSNWIGIVFARTLHYQFYVWYFHAVPLLLWINMLTTSNSSNKKGASLTTLAVLVRTALLRIGLWFVVEYAFNVFPATATSSLLLQVAHGIILVGFVRSPHALNIPMYSSSVRQSKGPVTSDDLHEKKQ